MTSRPCTALVLYAPQPATLLRVQHIYVNGHRFYRAAGWRCRCGMIYEGLVADMPACPIGETHD